MAVDVQDIVDVAARTVDAYREAELQILAIVAHHLEDGIDAPTWAQDRLNAVISLRRAAEAVMGRLASGDPAIHAAVARAARNGRGGAILDLPGPLGDAARAAQRDVPRVEVIDSLAAALIRDVGEKRRNVLRHVEDVYRQTITAAVVRSVAGGITRREASQAAWQGFVDRGVTSFTDVRGRVWRLSTYVEMAVRTVTMRAAVQGQTDRLIELGQHLVIVSDELGECARCRPYEGRVLRITPGPTGDVEVESAVADGMVTVHIAGTLPEAMVAGLLHPNCGHTIRAYLPGATRQPTGETADPDNNAARVRQREIERAIRNHKEREVAALTPEAARAARIKVRQWQAVMRQHLKDNPRLKRLPYREEIGGGNLPPGGKAPSPAGLLTGPSGGGGTGVDDRAARRAAARARQAEIDRRTPVADLVAEFDELLHKQAERATFEQRLDLATTSGVDQTVVATLRRALDTGDAGKIRSAITRVERKHDLKSIGRAGQTVRYDEALHEPVGDTPADGARVLVVRQGAVLNLDGETIQLSRARVTTAAAPPKASKPKSPVKAAGPASVRRPGRDMETEARQRIYELDNAGTGGSVDYGDPGLTMLVGWQPGWGDAARVVSQTDIDTAIAHGWTQLWRGVQASTWPTPIPHREVGELARTGPWKMGEGIYGNGFYASIRRTTAEEYRNSDFRATWPGFSGNRWGPAPLHEWLPGFDVQDGSLIRMAIDPKARLADYHTLEVEHRAWLWQQTGTVPEWRIHMKDIGWYAVMRGYDGMIVRGEPGINDGSMYPPGVGNRAEADQYVIFNRSVLLMERDDGQYDT